MGRFSLVMIAAGLAVAGCNPVQKSSELTVSGVPGQRLSAGPGDTVLDVKISKSLPNAFGKADLFGRTTDAGRVVVRYVGSSGKTAQLVRQDVVIETGETTMSRTPLIIPNTSTSTVNGFVGTTPVSGTATSTSYSVVGPRSTQGFSYGAAPIAVSVQEGRSITMEGHTISIVRVAPEGIDYTVN